MKRSHQFTVIAAALAGLLGLVPQAARADVLATATIELQNVLFNRGGVTLDAGDFAIASFTSSAAISATFNGVTSGAASVAAPIDLAMVCQGPGCPGGVTENAFPALTAPASGSFAAADQFESGAPITGLTGFTSPATVSSGSWAQVTSPTNGVAVATSNNGLVATFIFQLATAGDVTIDYDALYYWEYLVTGDERTPASALSTGNVVWTLAAPGVTTITFAPTELNWTQGFAALPVALGFDVGDCSPVVGACTPGVKSSTTQSHSFGTLDAGTIYTLTASVKTTADATRTNVPEPGTLLLFGVGLLGLALARRRLNVI